MKIHSESLFFDSEKLPRPANPAGAALGRQRWAEAADRNEDALVREFAYALAEDHAGGALLDAVFGNSPFLGQCLVSNPDFVATLCTDGPDAALAAILSGLERDAPPDTPTAGIMRTLRIARQRCALTVALADIGGTWPLETVIASLSAFADRALDCVLAHLLLQSHNAGELVLPDPSAPCNDSGLVVLGMGKLGAGELNYSSDIDLIVLFDHERIEYIGHDSAQQCFVRLVRELVRILEERTGDGYVFRTDLRLRPDPGSTPPAISMIAAETYYESTGQNWERAAMIKARPVAGDLAAGQRFLEFLRPFLWRRNLDFAAIQDIHSIKRQINAQRGGNSIVVAGHNIKLGRGGIREIEFFAQTQQLVWGGREPEIRCRATCDALCALAASGHIDSDAPDRLIVAYRFLRTVEHRLQMVDDSQTHDIPANPDGIAHIAAFCGFDDTEAFTTRLISELELVEKYYSELFEEEQDLGGPGTLVFTGGEDHPGTIRTLTELGFGKPSEIATLIRSWHHGRYRAMRSTRAREILTELTPVLLKAFADTADPDAAMLRLNEFLAGLPAGVQLFSLFHSNPGLLSLMAEIMGSAPRLAETLSRNPNLLDAVLTSDFFDSTPGPAALEEEMQAALTQARDFEDVLDILRRQTGDRVFQTGVHMLRGHLDPESAGAPLSDLADRALAALYPETEKELARHHGHVLGGAMAVVALGKLGGRELTLESDLDLLFIYDNPQAAEASDGERPLPPSQYFTRLGQRFINAVTAPTAEGKLYEIDMRLRPSGNAGPLATSLDAFTLYHGESAWTWEHMALTRARIINAPDWLADRINSAIHDMLMAKRDNDKLVHDVADMRRRMERERGGGDIWDIKNLRGGLVDVEFIAQYLQLLNAHNDPQVLAANTTDALAGLRAAGKLGDGDADTLIKAMHLWRKLQGMLRLIFGGDFVEKNTTDGSRAVLARACGAEDFDALREMVGQTAGRCHTIYTSLIDDPAQQ